MNGVIDPLGAKGELQDPAATGFRLEVRVNEKRTRGFLLFIALPHPPAQL
jgi:hypothetical protein